MRSRFRNVRGLCKYSAFHAARKPSSPTPIVTLVLIVIKSINHLGEIAYERSTILRAKKKSVMGISSRQKPVELGNHPTKNEVVIRITKRIPPIPRVILE